MPHAVLCVRSNTPGYDVIPGLDAKILSRCLTACRLRAVAFGAVALAGPSLAGPVACRACRLQGLSLAGPVAFTPRPGPRGGARVSQRAGRLLGSGYLTVTVAP